MMAMLKYWRAVLAAVLLLAAVSGCLMYGRAEYRRGHAAATAEISRELAETARREAAQQQAADAAYQKHKAANAAAERMQYVEIEKIVERPVYRNVCLDADGLRELNAAITK